MTNTHLAHRFVVLLSGDRTIAVEIRTDLDPHLARSCARELVADLELARDLDHALDLDRALDRARARARDLGLDTHLSLDRDLDLDHALALARDFERFLANVSATASSNGQLRAPTPLAGQLTAFAARLLPGAERARYSEEFRSELAEIALVGGGRRIQLAYAARTVLSSAWQLRAALRSPRRRGAVQ